MYSKAVEGTKLRLWTIAAAFGPAAQFCGSVPWYGMLFLSLCFCLLWMAAEDAPRGRVLRWVQLGILTVGISLAAHWSGACWPGAKNTWSISFTLLLLGIASAEGGPRTAARCGTVLFWILAGLFALLLGFALPEMEWEYLKPLNPRPEAWGKGALVLCIPLAAAGIPKEKAAWNWFLPLMTVAISAVTAGLLSPWVAEETEGAFFEMVRGISILGVAERFEALVAGAMTLSWFCLLSLFLSAGGQICEEIHKGRGRWGSWGIGVFAGILLTVGNVPDSWILTVISALFLGVFPILKKLEKKVKKEEKSP